ncbi:IMP cyclohydrolase [Oceanirhabdus sp. W0125-5]|uniref:IMP cyclohydrolase n=1 Tax=Oceanirhabdus sp. W0125-5 TaxID=2999116 RepID=UPI0022F31802|nr:IMP cyclohydrolase [Oceanirhabdus sp. W0125-5]WBW97225.1 IMP cyclohydrolase [Oceanirhabdus sp. W0125-5]
MKNAEFESNNIKRIQENIYPGRGIIIGKTPNNNFYVQVYWIMGRSNNSRNRIFEKYDNCVKTKAFDEKKLEDPTLIIYNPIKQLDYYHIVGNGDHTDTIYDYLCNSKTFEKSLESRYFEPDDPHYTPRISGIINNNLDNPHYKLSILKSINNNSEFCQRSFYNYENFISGYGHCIHTFKSDGHPLPSFDGEPFLVKLFDDIDENLNHFWNSLNQQNKVSLLVKYISVHSNEVTIKIKNKNQ